MKRNYYVSHHLLQGTYHENDIFDDVDVMGMAREFLRQLLQRKKELNADKKRIVSSK
eukprot:CAMPEP_0181090510 /NCGR_PEP_ID=MMETSP1071-20121207/7896_1 /TAXON_ID=35127 /ORGANISM="Thalassiosira sp., Strain NH16" /LENGTH=56 /DNA_ID=CAMNT_0023172573 /DNA_START=628 /DNA_END=795 /DNA_ORIENTATION=+